MNDNSEKINSLADELLNDNMAAYDSFFILNAGIPYIKEYSPNSLKLLDLTILFYESVIDELYNSHILLFAKDNMGNHNDNKIFFPYDYGWKVLEKFSRMVVETDNDSNSVSYYENSFCISSERYRMIEKLIANHFYGSKFEKIIYKLIGNYHFNYGFVRFSKDDQALLIHSANVYREWKKNSLVGKDGNEK